MTMTANVSRRAGLSYAENMARIVVYAGAYRGDVYPFVPIASELSDRGHAVTYMSPREYHADFAAEPFAVAATGSDSLGPESLAKHQHYVDRWGMRLGGALLLRLYFGKLLVPYLDDYFDALRDLADGADVILTHPASGILSSMVAEDLEMPWIAGDLFPMLKPTAARPPPGQPDLGRRGNQLLWKFSRSKVGAPMTHERDFAKYRRARGLDDTQRSPIDAMCSPHLNLGLTSPHYVAPEPDWDGPYQLTGFSFWSGPNRGAIGDDVVEYLDRGEPPVLVTLGSSAASISRFGATMDHLDRLGHRGLFLASTDDIARQLRAQNTDDRHGIWTFVPIAGILPRCRAVVHSGAHGTNSMVLSAGLPSVISPALFDQLWHGKRQEELGTGVLAKKPGDIGDALQRVLGDTSFADAARDFAELLAAEDGVANAADAIEAFLAAQ